jgi:hypothetical protein
MAMPGSSQTIKHCSMMQAIETLRQARAIIHFKNVYVAIPHHYTKTIRIANRRLAILEYLNDMQQRSRAHSLVLKTAESTQRSTELRYSNRPADTVSRSIV